MIRIERLDIAQQEDRRLVEATMRHPRIYCSIVDDSCPSRDKFRLPVGSFPILYCAVYDGDEYLGLFMLQQENGVTWEVHTCLLPEAWGNRAKKAAEVGRQWVWDNLGAERLITKVPKYNRLALKFAKCGGMVQYGLNPRSWKHHGKLWDMYLLGVSREEALCQQ